MDRQELVASPNTIFQDGSQRTDLENDQLTNTYLIELLGNLVAKGHIIEFTAVRTDHHDDTDLNPTPPYTGTHAHGWAADCWPLASAIAGDYLNASDERFLSFLRDAADQRELYQIGLAGSAYTNEAIAAAGETVFHDDGGDHVHLGAQAA